MLLIAMNPWEKQAWEDHTQYMWFNQYLLLEPPRRIQTLAKRPGCPWTWADLENLSHTNYWRMRAEKWDVAQAEQARRIVETHIDETANEMGRRHVRTWQKTSKMLGKILEKHSEAINASPAVDVSLPALVRMLETATKAERLILGQTTSNDGGGQDLSRLTDEEIEQWHALAKKASATG